mmetsp:Transcript_61514/g.71878  ORF Transcript_61514/g.71878 Transcript_61514/m.71878 type:complete len:175 (-) Transcript_61514:537-1061(-)
MATVFGRRLATALVKNNKLNDAISVSIKIRCDIHIFRKSSKFCRNDSSTRCFSVAATQPLMKSAEVASETVTISFEYSDGEVVDVDAELGQDLLSVCQEHDIELEGACGGELACATCHVVLDQDTYDDMPEKSEDEEDMLDMAMDLTDTSRLGCQCKVTNSFAGIKVKLPDDGF